MSERVRNSTTAVRLAVAGVTLAVVAASVLVVSDLTADDDRVDLLSGGEPLPEGSGDRTAEGAAQSAIDLAHHLGSISVSEGEPCPKEDLEASWEPPTAEFEVGAHYTPVGPEPTANTVSVNGILTCGDATHSYSGFNTRWDGEQWDADLTPAFFGDEDEGVNADGGHVAAPGSYGTVVDGEVVTADDITGADLFDPDAAAEAGEAGAGTDAGGPSGAADADEEGAEPSGDGDAEEDGAPVPGAVGDVAEAQSRQVDSIEALELTDDWEGLWDEEPERLADYDPQRICSPDPKPGTVGFRDLVLEAYPDTSDSGIGRDCAVSPDGLTTSEHYEGRAWDWAVDVSDPADRKAASEIIGWLLATDEDGERYAMARRLGVMYIIFNNSMWRSYRADQAWVGYTGPNPHTDHVHISFDRPGGLGDTTFWDAEGLPDVAATGFGPVGYLPQAGGIAVGRAAEGTTSLGDGARSDRPGSGGGGSGTDIPGIPKPEGDGGGSGGGDGVAPTLPGAPSVPTVPGVGDDLPFCKKGTPVLPPPTDCVIRPGSVVDGVVVGVGGGNGGGGGGNGGLGNLLP